MRVVLFVDPSRLSLCAWSSFKNPQMLVRLLDFHDTTEQSQLMFLSLKSKYVVCNEDVVAVVDDGDVHVRNQNTQLATSSRLAVARQINHFGIIVAKMTRRSLSPINATTATNKDARIFTRRQTDRQTDR